MNLKYLKENTAPITKINPPWYWAKLPLNIIGDSIIDLPVDEEYSGLRVSIVEEDVEPIVVSNCLIISTKEARNMDWLD